MPSPLGAFWNSAIRPCVCPMAQLPRLYRHAGCLQLSHRWPPLTRDVRSEVPSADGRRSAAIFATVELPSTGAYRITRAAVGTEFLSPYPPHTHTHGDPWGSPYPRQICVSLPPRRCRVANHERTVGVFDMKYA